MTTAANEALAPIHHRMPAVVLEGDWNAWFDPQDRRTPALQVLPAPSPAEALEAYRVSRQAAEGR